MRRPEYWWIDLLMTRSTPNIPSLFNHVLSPRLLYYLTILPGPIIVQPPLTLPLTTPSPPRVPVIAVEVIVNLVVFLVMLVLLARWRRIKQFAFLEHVHKIPYNILPTTVSTTSTSRYNIILQHFVGTLCLQHSVCNTPFATLYLQHSVATLCCNTL